MKIWLEERKGKFLCKKKKFVVKREGENELSSAGSNSAEGSLGQKLPRNY